MLIRACGRRRSRTCLCVRLLSVFFVVGTLSWISYETNQRSFLPKDGLIVKPKSITTSTTSTTASAASTTASASAIPSTTPTSLLNPLPSMQPTHNERTVGDHAQESDFIPPPLQVWNEYIAQHGESALRKEVFPLPPIHEDGGNHNHTAQLRRREHDRKFLVAPYGCPDPAGHVLHNLWNSMAWAILLNRTALLRWVDTEPNPNTTTTTTTTRQDCLALLPPRAEIPLYEEWHDRWDIQEEDIFSIPLDVNRIHYDSVLTTVLVPQIKDVYSDRRDLYRNGWVDHPLSPNQPAYREYLSELWGHGHNSNNNSNNNNNNQNHNIQQLKKTAQLFYWGVPFLYGMMFRHMFILPHDIPTTESPSSSGVVSTTTHHPDITARKSLALALHSHHVASSDDKSLVSQEIACLQEWFVQRNATEGHDLNDCHIYVLSDHRPTLATVTAWIHNQAPTCRVVTTQRDGLSAGAGGLLRDLAAATSTSFRFDAMIGDSHRSSFALWHELVVYDNFRHDPRGPQLELPDVQIPVCSLSHRTAASDSYGSWKPVFVPHQEDRFPPLEPVQALSDYRKHILQPKSPKRFLLVALGCPTDENYELYILALIVAIVSERTLLWTPTTNATSTCRVQSWLTPWNDRAAQRYNLNIEDAVDLMRQDAATRRFARLSPESLDRMVHMFSRDKMLNLPPNPSGREAKVLAKLFVYGRDFLFGFLLNEMFHLPLVDMKSKGNALERQTWTVGLDARKVQKYSDIRPCLEKSLKNRPQERECNIFMLKGPETANAQALKTRMNNLHQCSVTVVEDSNPERAFAIVRQVRDGWITSHNFLDALGRRIRERIEMERVSEIWTNGESPVEVPPFVDCTF